MDNDEIDALLRQYDKKNFWIYKKKPKRQFGANKGSTAHFIFNYRARRKPPPITLPKLKFHEFEFNEDWSTSSSPKEESQ